SYLDQPCRFGIHSVTQSIMCKRIFFIAIAFAAGTQIPRSLAADAEWDRTVLPRPAQPFQGVADRTCDGAKAALIPPAKAPPDAPNILLVLIDDAGFGNPSTFGGPVAT